MDDQSKLGAFCDIDKDTADLDCCKQLKHNNDVVQRAMYSR